MSHKYAKVIQNNLIANEISARVALNLSASEGLSCISSVDKACSGI